MGTNFDEKMERLENRIDSFENTVEGMASDLTDIREQVTQGQADAGDLARMTLKQVMQGIAIEMIETIGKALWGIQDNQSKQTELLEQALAELRALREALAPKHHGPSSMFI